MFFAFAKRTGKFLSIDFDSNPDLASPMTFKAYDIDYGSSQNLAQFPRYGRMLLGIYLNPNIATPNITK